jgi:hypothetical protein
MTAMWEIRQTKYGTKEHICNQSKFIRLLWQLENGILNGSLYVQMIGIWVLILCSIMSWFQSFERKHYLHFQSDWISCRWVLQPWRWRHNFPLKYQAQSHHTTWCKNPGDHYLSNNLSTCNSLNIISAHIFFWFPTYIDDNILLITFVWIFINRNYNFLQHMNNFTYIELKTYLSLFANYRGSQNCLLFLHCIARARQCNVC